MRQEVIQKAPERAKKQTPNLTGIPTQMKLDFERRSGLSFDDVRVHYNSDKPRRIGALAYTQIPQVHIGPGQERHLRHELGHVVQQKQGIVRPTTWINGLPVNDSPDLEHSASEFPQLSNHSTWYSPFNDVQSAIQMLALNAHTAGGRVIENRRRISRIEQVEPTDIEPRRYRIYHLSLEHGDTRERFYVDNDDFECTIDYFKNQSNWIEFYYNKLQPVRTPVDRKLHTLKEVLASATNMGEDAFVLFKEKGEGRMADGGYECVLGIKEQITGLVNTARERTGFAQNNVFMSLSSDVGRPQRHYDARGILPSLDGLTYQKDTGKDLEGTSGHPTCIAFICSSAGTSKQRACYNSKIRTGERTNIGLLPKYIHPTIAEKIRALLNEQLGSYWFTKGVGTHAEIYAVNKYLKMHPVIPPETKLVILRPTDTGYRPFGRCAHCHDVLEPILQDTPNLSLWFNESIGPRGGGQGAARSRGGAVRGRGGATRGRGGATRGRGGAAADRGGAAADRGGTT